ncbi:MAG TPA: nuclear transport factor 2 family protein [Hyphomicrobium sp.]
MPTQRKSFDETEIRALIAQWADATRTKNLDAVMSAYAPGATTFDLAPPLQYDTDALRAQLAAWFPGFNGPVDYAIGDDLDVAVSGDVGFSHSIDRLGGKRHSGEEFQIWVRVTMGFRKIGNAWKVAHVHTSVPFYMDGSFKAAVDLAP